MREQENEGILIRFKFIEFKNILIMCILITYLEFSCLCISYLNYNFMLDKNLKLGLGY